MNTITDQETEIVLESIQCLKALKVFPEMLEEMKKNNQILQALVEEMVKVKEKSS